MSLTFIVTGSLAIFVGSIIVIITAFFLASKFKKKTPARRIHY